MCLPTRNNSNRKGTQKLCIRWSLAQSHLKKNKELENIILKNKKRASLFKFEGNKRSYDPILDADLKRVY